MTVKEFYESIGSDYSRVLKTLMNDAIAKKFALKFLEDESYKRVKTAIESEDIHSQFSAVHAFKGVVGNLGFYRLYDAVSVLCEQLRPLNSKADVSLVQKMNEEYDNVIQALEKFKKNN